MKGLGLRRAARELDRVLRGELSTQQALRDGGFSLGRVIALALVLGMGYGACMGSFAALRGAGRYFLTPILKVPLLFLATLAVTFPSLYVFSALEGSPLRARETLKLLVVAIAVNLAVLAGFGPVTVFFSACTTSYPFIKLFNVAVFGLAGLISLGALRRAMDRVLETHEPSAVEAPMAAEASPGEPGPRRGRARRVFFAWLLVYATVGAQMGWVLRPFIGAPGVPFELFRGRESNVFLEIVKALRALVE